MAAWTDPRGDLRIFLADTDRDNLVKDQKVLGSTSGQNRTFTTFHDRLATSGYQDGRARPLRVFQGGPGTNPVEVAASGILVTDPYRGEFQMMLVPSGNVELKASYYFQQHIDGELDFYLAQAAGLVNADVAGNIPVGLQGAALRYAASLAHERLAQRWFFRKSDQFMLHDTPAEEATVRIQYHRETATFMSTQAGELRRSYYDLQHDRGRRPAYALLKRTPKPWGPNR